jgi:dinuclear metal center YbgI/SA1388 family protein
VITRRELSGYLNDFLKCTTYNDYAPNGLQVEGRERIKRICTAVTASEDVISRAVTWQADALLVHHGYFWRGENSIITGMKHQRISMLLRHDINLFAYHLPLDCHPELGNNASIAKLLPLSSFNTHKANSVDNLLWSGVLAQSMQGALFSNVLEKIFGRGPLHIAGNDKAISSIAWCTGAAQDLIEDAHQLGVDAYLSGEVAERTYYQAKELGIHYYSCGHHATERYGIQALGQYLASHFKLDHVFLDSDNPV